MKSPTEQEKKDVYEDEKEGLGTKPSPNLPFRKLHEKWIWNWAARWATTKFISPRLARVFTSHDSRLIIAERENVGHRLWDWLAVVTHKGRK